MALELIGKSSPLPGELQRAAEDGFKKIELYMREDFLTERHLKFLSDARRDLGLEVYSIHTPHSKPEVFVSFLEKTKVFARRASISVIVVHSSLTNAFSNEVVRHLGKNTFVENGYGHNLPFLEKAFGKGVRICLDMAHFYVASLSTGRDYYKDLEFLFSKHGESIGHIHIADATEGFAGKKPPISELDNYDANVGDGEIDFFKAMPIVSKHYSGVAVVEVDTDRQWTDCEKLNKIMSVGTRKEGEPRVSRHQHKA